MKWNETGYRPTLKIRVKNWIHKHRPSTKVMNAENKYVTINNLYQEESKENKKLISDLERTVHALRAEIRGILQGFFDEETEHYVVDIKRADSGFTYAHVTGSNLSLDTREFPTARQAKAFVTGALVRYSGNAFPSIEFRNKE